MGYSTDFYGSFVTDKPVDDETYNLLYGLATTRRMVRNVDPIYGVDGEFYIDGMGDYGQDRDASIVDYNRPPRTQPGLWCQWLIQEDRRTIEWDGGEKFYEYDNWIRYIVAEILEPRGYILNGRVKWQGEYREDYGEIRIENNRVMVGR
jgi:hypothetical protein